MGIKETLDKHESIERIPVQSENKSGYSVTFRKKDPRTDYPICLP